MSVPGFVAVGGGGGNVMVATHHETICRLIAELGDPSTRENALVGLSKYREVLPDLAPLLWNSFGTVAALVQEMIKVFPSLLPATMTAHESNRVCGALALFQCIASHPETRCAFLEAQIPLYIFPFLRTVSKERHFEYLRLTALGVIGSLVKTEENLVIAYLLTTEMIPLCLRLMDTGSELSRTVATFILLRIILDDAGLEYVCATYPRFSHVATILSKMINSLERENDPRLLKHVVRCYLRLSDHSCAREALSMCLPDQLKDNTFSRCFEEDRSIVHLLQSLHENLAEELPQRAV